MISLGRHQVLHVEGDRGGVIYAVVEGTLWESRATADGRTQGIRLITEGDVVGLESLVGEPYRSTLEALAPAKVCRVAAWEAGAFLALRPDAQRALGSLAIRQTLALSESVRLLGAGTAEERVLAVVRRLAADKPAGTWVRLPVTRKELAELAGLADPTVSRIIQRFVRAGKLEVRGRWLRVQDPGLLADPATDAA